MSRFYRYAVLFLSILLLLNLSACQKTPDERTLSVFQLEPTPEQKETMWQAYLDWRVERGDKILGDIGTWDDYAATWSGDYENRAISFGNRYYGTFDGCMVWFQDSTAEAIMEMTLGGSYFFHSTDGRFYVCREGKHMTLEDAHAQGFISDQDVAIVAARHWEFDDWDNLVPGMVQESHTYPCTHQHDH